MSRSETIAMLSRIDQDPNFQHCRIQLYFEPGAYWPLKGKYVIKIRVGDVQKYKEIIKRDYPGEDTIIILESPVLNKQPLNLDEGWKLCTLQ